MNRIKIEYLQLSELIPYECNPRIHSDQQIEKLMSSIKNVGIILPVLIDENKMIMAGCL